MKGLGIHKDDINSVDWSKVDQNYVVTGSTDCKACIVDIRKLSQDGISNNRSQYVVKELVGH